MKHINSFRSKKKHLKMKNWIRDIRGTTLVELIVTFALLGLFMTAASSMLTSTLQLFTRMQATSRAITVSDMLLDKISGEITAAILPISTSTDGYYFWLDPKDKPDGDGKSRWVVFRNRSKSPIAIFAAEPDPDSGKADVSTMGKGELFIRYYAVSGNELKKVPELDWHLDSRTYMGYRIKDLWFEREKTDHPNVVKINLTLENDRTGFEYTTFRYAENYNYDFASNYMCERTEIKAQADAGKTNFPVQADEFKIERSSGGGETPDPDEPTIPYGVKCYNGYNLIYQNENFGLAYPKEKKFLKLEEIPEIAGYRFNEIDSSDYLNGITILENVMVAGKDNTFVLFYDKVEEPVTGFTVYYKSTYSGKEIREKKIVSARITPN